MNWPYWWSSWESIGAVTTGVLGCGAIIYSAFVLYKNMVNQKKKREKDEPELD